MSLFIPDGCTETATLRLWARGKQVDVTYRYRPALPEDCFEYMTAPKQSGKQYMQAVTALLLKHLVSWDAADKEGGESVPVTEAALRRVPSQKLLEMVNRVSSYGEPGPAEAEAKN